MAGAGTMISAAVARAPRRGAAVVIVMGASFLLAAVSSL
jgi:hypothetical protein